MNARKSRERRKTLILTGQRVDPAAYGRQPYAGDMLAATKDAKLGTVTHVYIAHDSWCPLLRGVGPCCCKPEITTRREGDGTH